jgi:hypothetical protein
MARKTLPIPTVVPRSSRGWSAPAPFAYIDPPDPDLMARAARVADRRRSRRTSAR